MPNGARSSKGKRARSSTDAPLKMFVAVPPANSRRACPFLHPLASTRRGRLLQNDLADVGVPDNFTREDIIAAFKREVKKAHPDVGGGFR